jgi:outer membrane murein-binding lipoprotein Lpp
MNKVSNISPNSKPLKSKNNKRNYLTIAASVIGLLFAGSIYLYSELNNKKEQLKLVENQNRELNTKIDKLAKDFNETTIWYASINNPETVKYVLSGNSLMPDVKVISYINNSKKSVLINTQYLPVLDKEHDYQMWADVKGEMIDMGIIDTSQIMLAMNYIENSESLNITIEPAGGNDHPTVSKLISNVYLN